MPGTTSSYVKNIMRRAIGDIMDQPLSKKQKLQVWEYFFSQCAYCGCELHRENRDGHIDHLIAAAMGGSNSLNNRVLACEDCNGNEKRDRAWEEFLREKCKGVGKVFRVRRDRITAWQNHTRRNAATVLTPEVKEAISAAEALIPLFEQKLSTLKSAVRKSAQ